MSSPSVPAARTRSTSAWARSSCSRVGMSAARFLNAQPVYWVCASSSRSTRHSWARAITSPMRSRFCRWSTTLRVTGNPSRLAPSTASRFLSNEGVPASRSFDSGRVSSTLTWKWSSPASRSSSSRLPSTTVAPVLMFE